MKKFAIAHSNASINFIRAVVDFFILNFVPAFNLYGISPSVDPLQLFILPISAALLSPVIFVAEAML